jgi:transposase
MPLSEKEKYEIVVKNELGISTTKIAKDLKTSRVTVTNWIKRYQQTKSIKRQSCSGRKKSY